LWWDEKNDPKCRQWSRDVALLFKKELQRSGAETSENKEGWIGKRGSHGATMVYGNYDRKYLLQSLSLDSSLFGRHADMK
jgi:hypothetical protein